MNNLSPDFQFSQHILQDYTDCNYRFFLRYLDRMAWPAEHVQDALLQEDYMQQGQTFHNIVHQHLMGLPAERLLQPYAPEHALHQWWVNFLTHGLQDVPLQRHPEKMLSIRFAEHPVVGRYDLIAIEPGRRAVIVDWKTNRTRPKREHLARRWQTRLYPYLLIRAGAAFNNGQAFTPEQIEMRYWFANFPEAPESFFYDSAQFADDETALNTIIETLTHQQEFPKTSNEHQCKFCHFRAFCGRGSSGKWAEMDDLLMDDTQLDDEVPITDLDF